MSSFPPFLREFSCGRPVSGVRWSNIDEVKYLRTYLLQFSTKRLQTLHAAGRHITAYPNIANFIFDSIYGILLSVYQEMGTISQTESNLRMCHGTLKKKQFLSPLKVKIWIYYTEKPCLLYLMNWICFFIQD